MTQPAPAAATGARSDGGALVRLIMVLLLGVAILAIAVAAVPPWLIRPYRLAALVAERRAGTAMLGLAGLVSIGAAYLLTRAGS